MRDRFASPLSYYYRIFWKRNPRRITSPSRNPIATSNGPALRVNLLIRSSGIMGRVTRREAFNSGSDSCFRSDRENRMNRRNFMQNAVAGALAGTTASSQAAPPASKMIGLQVGAVSFVDEGVNQVLDIFQQSASVNTLFVATFTYGRGIAGRQVPGQPLPDHGKQEYDTA